MTDIGGNSTLLNKIWSFERDDGSIIARGVRLQYGGEILNHSEPNERSWRFDDGILAFVSEAGEISTRFESQSLDSNGLVILKGQFRLASDINVVHVLRETVAVKRASQYLAKPKTAVLVRTHKPSLKLTNLINCLSSSPLYDLFVTADETRAPVHISEVPKLSHSIQEFASIGLYTQRNDILWLCGDYPLYLTSRMLPDHEYFIQIEYDVHFTRENSLYLEGIINRLCDDGGGGFDYVAPKIVSTTPGWPLAEPVRAHFSKTYWGGIFAFVLLSRRAIEYLFALRLREKEKNPLPEQVMHCEAFVPTAIVNHGAFRTADLNELLPGTVERSTFHPGSRDEPNYILKQVVTRNPKIEMIHPVFDYQEYYGREITRAVEANDLPQLLSEVRSAPRDVLTDAMRAEIIEWIRARSAN